MFISIITVSLNSEKTIQGCIDSVAGQGYPQKEHIIVDGLSTDNTIQIINHNEFNISRFISQKDFGIYDALNKGINLAKGDIIALLHSDDLFANKNVLLKVVDAFKLSQADCVYGDLIYFHTDDPDKVIRYWKAKELKCKSLRYGWMPPHPALFIKKKIYYEYGMFDLRFKIAADYEIILRLFKDNKLKYYYLPDVLTKMRYGGVSNKNIRNVLNKSREDYAVLKLHRFPHPLFTLFMKNLRKLPQFRVP